MKKNIKIVGVISSSKIKGNTATLVREALKGAKEEGASVKEIFLAKHKLNFCTGCLNCTAKGKCPLPDDFEEIRKTIYEADGIILGSPTYATEYNAIMKCFIERLGPYTLYASLLGGKYGAGISTAYGAGAAKKVAKKLANTFGFAIFQRSYVSGYLGVGTMFKGEEKKSCENEEALKKAHNLGVKITKDIENNNKYPFQSLIIRLMAGVYLKPIFKNKILNCKAGEERATYESLSKRGLL
ncbi:flavodoxin family protein [Clostridium neuense]|uniref:Flavodoxin family protein n=1 Tax=Clostridium neuense TaxID=1728934 RepID=A0ABW8TEM2_9CLOT